MLFKFGQLVLLFQEKPVVEPQELAVDEEIRVIRLVGVKLSIAVVIFSHCGIVRVRKAKRAGLS